MGISKRFEMLCKWCRCHYISLSLRISLLHLRCSVSRPFLGSCYKGSHGGVCPRDACSHHEASSSGMDLLTCFTYYLFIFIFYIFIIIYLWLIFIYAPGCCCPRDGCHQKISRDGSREYSYQAAGE